MKPKKPPPPMEDEEQSRRFLETARELEAAGELDPTDSGEAFDRLLTKAAPAKLPKSG